MSGSDLVVVQLDKARLALSEAKTLQDTKKIIDIATSAEVYAKRQKLSQEAIDYAHDIKIEALAQLGRMLQETDKNEGGRPTKTGNGSEPVIPTLADIGIDKKTSSIAQKLAALPKEQFEQVRSGHVAVDRALKVAQVERRKADITQQSDALAKSTPSAPLGLFNVIAIDPPWPYDDGVTQSPYDAIGHRASNPYPEMSLQQIGNLKIPAAPDCVLWLWTTHKFMRHAFPLLDAWGFQERAILTWAKDRMGLGRWLRSQSEFCIMATVGNPPLSLTNQTTLLNGPMREHSRKPDEFYAMVDSLCVGRKLDYFSRESRAGWEQFGNDTARFVG